MVNVDLTTPEPGEKNKDSERRSSFNFGSMDVSSLAKILSPKENKNSNSSRAHPHGIASIAGRVGVFGRPLKTASDPLPRLNSPSCRDLERDKTTKFLYGSRDSVRKLSTELEAVRIQDRPKQAPKQDNFIDLTSEIDEEADSASSSETITELIYRRNIKSVTLEKSAGSPPHPRRKRDSQNGDLKTKANERLQITPPKTPIRDPTLSGQKVSTPPHELKLDAIQIYGATFLPGSNVELAGNCVLADGTPLRTTHFLRIHRFIYDNKSKRRVAYGELFVRQAHLGGIFPNKAGELVLINDNAAVDVTLIMCKRNLIKTNRLWPECQIDRAWQVFDENGNPRLNSDGNFLYYNDCADEKAGLLICRWKADINNDPLATTAKGRWGSQGSIMRLRYAEADEGYGVPDIELVKKWRAPTENATAEASRATEDPSTTPRIPKAPNAALVSTPQTARSPKKNSISSTASEDRIPRVNHPVVIDLISDPRKRRRSYPPDQREAEIRDSCDCKAKATSEKNSLQHINSAKRQKLSSTTSGNDAIFIINEERSNSARGPKMASSASPSTRNNEPIRLPAMETPRTPRRPRLAPDQSLQRGPRNAPVNLVNRVISFIKKQYTIGDIFCGGGGVSQGAIQAGLKIIFGVDFDAAAIDTYARNFGRIISHHTDVNHFLTKAFEENAYNYPDILHMSPPCQTFSWAHTTPGKNDENNEASFLVGEQALKVCRPRQVTLEETDALLSLPDSEYMDGRSNFSFFKGLINAFTTLGFSVRWSTLEGQDFGVCCKRRRLIIIASCPGETPARFPIRTHTTNRSDMNCSRTNRTLKYTPTIGRALAGIPEDASHHDTTPEVARPLPGVASAEDHYNWTIVTKGGGGKYLYHYNGLRKFTPRELACIMSFPPKYKFGRDLSVVDVRKIVGNAVPPNLAEAIFRQVVKHLERTDAEYAAASRDPDGQFSI